MLSLDKSGVDKLLLRLEEKQFTDSRYKFVKENGELKLLGTGGFSYVYEMYDSLAPENHYAAKVIGLGTKAVDSKLILDTTRIQYYLSEQSENIMRVIALWSMKLRLDEDGDLVDIIGVNQEGYDEAGGVLLEIILMEKLENILAKDKYGNIELLRDELKKEDGVIRFAENIGRALFTVHNNGFLHRDIKLENIFWDQKSNQYKLGDFGITKYVGEGDAETIVFTDGYGAPEIECRLAESYNLTADIYSLGITLFLLLNELKFPGSEGYHANMIQYSKDFIVPAPLNASHEMAGIIRRMCSYRTKDRYQSVEEVLMDIGRIDGSYTEEGFTEYDNLETETYRENEGYLSKAYYKDSEKTEKNNAGVIPLWRRKDSELSREERKKEIKFRNESYAFDSICEMAFTTLLTILLLKSFSPEATYIERWEFWILPIAVFIEAILQRVKEFHAEFGFVTICVAFFSMHYLGVHIPQIAAIIVVLMRIPAITAGFSFGTGLWILQMVTGKMAWLSFFSERDLGWIVLIMIAAIIQGFVFIREDYEKANHYETVIITWIMNMICYLMILAGIVFPVLGFFKLIEIPEIIKHIHLVKTGIGIYIVEWLFCILYYE